MKERRLKRTQRLSSTPESQATGGCIVGGRKGFQRFWNPERVKLLLTFLYVGYSVAEILIGLSTKCFILMVHSMPLVLLLGTMRQQVFTTAICAAIISIDVVASDETDTTEMQFEYIDEMVFSCGLGGLALNLFCFAITNPHSWWNPPMAALFVHGLSSLVLVTHVLVSHLLPVGMYWTTGVTVVANGLLLFLAIYSCIAYRVLSRSWYDLLTKPLDTNTSELKIRELEIRMRSPKDKYKGRGKNSKGFGKGPFMSVGPEFVICGRHVTVDGGIQLAYTPEQNKTSNLHSLVGANEKERVMTPSLLSLPYLGYRILSVIYLGNDIYRFRLDKKGGLLQIPHVKAYFPVGCVKELTVFELEVACPENDQEDLMVISHEFFIRNCSASQLGVHFHEPSQFFVRPLVHFAKDLTKVKLLKTVVPSHGSQSEAIDFDFTNEQEHFVVDLQAVFRFRFACSQSDVASSSQIYHAVYVERPAGMRDPKQYIFYILIHSSDPATTRQADEILNSTATEIVIDREIMLLRPPCTFSASFMAYGMESSPSHFCCDIDAQDKRMLHIFPITIRKENPDFKLVFPRVTLKYSRGCGQLLQTGRLSFLWVQTLAAKDESESFQPSKPAILTCEKFSVDSRSDSGLGTYATDSGTEHCALQSKCTENIIHMAGSKHYPPVPDENAENIAQIPGNRLHTSTLGEQDCSESHTLNILAGAPSNMVDGDAESLTNEKSSTTVKFDDSGEPASLFAEKKIRPDGGEMKVGHHIILFPTGALTVKKLITMEVFFRYENLLFPNDLIPISHVIECSPGNTSFSKMLTFTIPVWFKVLKKSIPPIFAYVYKKTKNSAWDCAAQIKLDTSDTISFPIVHFCKVAVFIQKSDAESGYFTMDHFLYAKGETFVSHLLVSEPSLIGTYLDWVGQCGFTFLLPPGNKTLVRVDQKSMKVSLTSMNPSDYCFSPESTNINVQEILELTSTRSLTFVLKWLQPLFAGNLLLKYQVGRSKFDLAASRTDLHNANAQSTAFVVGDNASVNIKGDVNTSAKAR